MLRFTSIWISKQAFGANNERSHLPSQYSTTVIGQGIGGKVIPAKMA
jgi:hypothetical protein